MIPSLRVLLTGFEPFAGELLNPSALIAEALHGKRVGGAEVVGRVLPCAFARSSGRLIESIGTVLPSAVVCLGQAGGREGISIERVAINVDDARIADNDGAQPMDTAIVESGPAAYWSTLPVRSIVSELKAAGVSAAVSQTAGTFVCNHVFYALMHALATTPVSGVRAAGFVHVPWLPEQPFAQQGQPSMPLDAQMAAIEKVIEVTLLQTEIRSAGGAVRTKGPSSNANPRPTRTA